MFSKLSKPLKNLTKLDLSGNYLETDLQFKTFENQKNMEELHLSNMGMSNFTIQISHITKLQNLDISSNNLKCLDKEAMREMSKLSLHLRKYVKPKLHVNLHGNPLKCSCECYPFLKWFKATDILFSEKQSLSCKFKEVTYHLTDIEEIFMILEATCFPYTWFHIMIGTEIVVWALISLCIIVRIQKYRIYFLYLKLHIMVVSKLIAEDVELFDAFISYAEQDREWIKKKLIRNWNNEEN